MHFSTNLRYLRERRGELQKDIADLLDISNVSMGRYESGECEPDIAKLIILAGHFEITVDDLIRKDLKPPKPRCADNLKYLRQKNGLAHGEISNLLKISQREVSNYESGEREIPIEKLILLSDFFGVTLDQMVKHDLSKEGM